jgi:hypothetical protein
MSRNSSGTYSLPAGNPVVTGTVISSSWANTTMSDIATALTGSLDRSGQGGMLAALQLFAGTIGAPGLTWSLETTSGLYRAGAGDFRWAIGGADIWKFTSTIWQFNTRTIINGTDPEIDITESDGAADNKTWGILAQSEQFNLYAINDARSSFVSFMRVDRTGTAIDTVNFPNGVLQYAGSEVAKRFNAPNTIAGAYALVNGDNGKMVRQTAAGAVTLNTGLTAGFSCIVVNDIGGGTTVTLTQGAGAAVLWYPGGSPRVGAGSRTLGESAVAYCLTDGTNWFVWGTGIT